MVSTILLLALAASPPARAPAAAAPEELPTIDAPLGHIGDVVEPMPKGGLPGGENGLAVSFAGCEPQVVYLSRMLSGTARAVEQMDQWLAKAPEVKKKLFGKKDALADTITLMRDADRAPVKACKPPKLTDGYKVLLDKAPKKLCPDKEPRGQGDFWFLNKKKPAAVVHVLPGDLDACRLRISTVLFDSKGKARVRLHANYGGKLSAELLGEGCKGVDFALDEATQTFRATLKPCKR